MTDLFSILPDIILYIILGYVYLHSYRITRIIPNSNDHEHILIESLVFGFIIKNIAAIIPISFGYFVDLITMIICSMISGYAIAKILDIQEVTDFIVNVLKIRQTRFQYMWQNISESDMAIFVDVTNPETNVRYFGQLVLYEDFERQPIIQLANYTCWENDNVIYDFSEDPTRTVLIDTSKYSDIDIVYQKSSNIINRWRNKNTTLQQ